MTKIALQIVSIACLAQLSYFLYSSGYYLIAVLVLLLTVGYIYDDFFCKYVTESELLEGLKEDSINEIKKISEQKGKIYAIKAIRGIAVEQFSKNCSIKTAKQVLENVVS